MRRANRDPDQEGAAATEIVFNFLLIEVNITITLNTMSTPLFRLFGEPAYELKMVRMNFSLNFPESRMTIRMNQRQNRIDSLEMFMLLFMVRFTASSWQK